MRAIYILVAIPVAVVLAAGCASEQMTDAPAKPATDVGTKKDVPPVNFSYTESPTIAMIPESPIRGEANGKPFEVKTVVFQPGRGENWDLYLLDTKLEDPLDVLLEGQYIAIQLTERPGAGVTMTRPLDFGDGLFQIGEIDTPEETTSWNSPNAWAIEITQWDVRPWNPDGEIFQVAGTAAGKVAVCYQGSCGFADSWAAGTFTNAVVRYMGPPKDVK